MTQSTTEADAQVTIRRTIKAPRQKVFDAWTQPEHLKNWWRCNPNWLTDIAEVDLRVGGQCRPGMQDPDRSEPHVCFGEFTEISEPEKIVYTWSWEPPEMDVSGSMVTVEFLDRGNSTELVLTHERLPNASVAGEHNKGWAGAIDLLVALVEAW